jgi:hypothetical protein
MFDEQGSKDGIPGIAMAPDAIVDVRQRGQIEGFEEVGVLPIEAEELNERLEIIKEG